MSLMVIPLGFLIVYCKDVILLKLHLVRNKKKGAKFVVKINNDKTVHIAAMTPDKNKFQISEGVDCSIDPNRLFFAPQFGVQAAIIPEGAQSIFDPFADEKLDPMDGERFNLAIKRAKDLALGQQGWFDSKEGKLILLVLIVCIITAALVFMQSGTLNTLAVQVAGMKGSIDAIPRGLAQVL